MPTVQEIAQLVIDHFDGKATSTVEAFVEHLLIQEGYDRFTAGAIAAEKARDVVALLQTMDESSLPFEFSQRHANRLIGKQRVRSGETGSTAVARQGLAQISSMLQAVYSLGASSFERLCLTLMRLSGATDVNSTPSSDDGGIDLYGRILLRPPDPNVPSGLLSSTLLDIPLLFLGQCKCYYPTAHIGRPEIVQFRSAVDACIHQYAGNIRPPSHRVPAAYYHQGELCMPIFLSTADYTAAARAAALAHDIILISGRQIASFLVYHHAAMKTLPDGTQVTNVDLLRSWLNAL